MADGGGGGPRERGKEEEEEDDVVCLDPSFFVDRRLMLMGLLFALVPGYSLISVLRQTCW